VVDVGANMNLKVDILLAEGLIGIDELMELLHEEVEVMNTIRSVMKQKEGSYKVDGLLNLSFVGESLCDEWRIPIKSYVDRWIGGLVDWVFLVLWELVS
jgi:hypothetical protein